MSKKYKNKYFSLFKKQFSKFAVVLVVVSMLFGTLGINQTSAYFSDEATIEGNTFTAGTLDINVDKTDLGTAKLGIDNNLTITNSGSLLFEYGIKAEFSNTSDIAFCNQLNVAVSDGSSTYTNNLSSFDFSKIIEKDGHNDLVINISDPSDSVVGKTCVFNFVLKAWQKELDYEQGFTDIAYTSVIVNSEKVAPTPSINPGDVVINEIMWMGSVENSDEEWIELRNITGNNINITGWKIDGAESGSPGTLILPSSTISANGFFLISRRAANDSKLSDNINVNLVVAGLSFLNGGEQLTLKNASGNIIDQTPVGVWAAGEDSSLNKSMERNIIPIPGDGTLTGSWHTCIDSGCNSETYWDTVGGNNYGTPGGQNLSTNDPTAPDYDPTFVSEIIPAASVEPEESPLSATLPEEIPQASPEEVVETEDVVPEVIAEIPQATKPEEVITEESEVVETPISDVIEPEIIQIVEEEPVESVEPEESPLSATLPEEIPPASPDEIAE